MHRIAPYAVLAALVLSAAASARTTPVRNGSLAFVRMYGNAPESGEIWAIGADGTRARQLTRNPGYDGEPAWSPDGRSIAFATYRGYLGVLVWVMRSDGTGLHRLTSQAATWDPSWSPDGKRIAYANGNAVETMNADGSDDGPILETVVQGGDVLGSVWSPTGDRIAYTSSGDLYSIAPDGSEQRLLARRVNGKATWSPDGRRIAYAADRGGGSDIYVANADGSHPIDITRSAAYDASPAWSPDGKLIAFASDRAARQHTEIYVMHTDGSAVARVTRSGRAWRNDSSAWQPKR